MPFTVSHIAAVLPLPRKRLLFSALMVGSVAPDLPHVLLLTEGTRYDHTMSGLFVVSLPIGLAALFLFELLLKRALLALSPDAVRLRIPAERPFAIRSASRITWILASLLIGSMTHILWDSFTHSNGFLVASWPLLRQATSFWPYRPFYKLLQPLFSIVGLAAIAFAYRSWIRNTPVCQANVIPALASRVAMVVTGTFMVGAFGLLYSYFYLRIPTAHIYRFVATVLYGALAAGFFAILLFSLWWHLLRERVSSASLSSDP